MASYPSQKKHTRNRRVLGKNQFPSGGNVTVVVTDSGSTATLTFSGPVVVTGPIPLGVSGGLTLVTQTVTSPTVVTQLYSAALTTRTYSLPPGAVNVATFQGGQVSGTSGTFS